jgi:hypothetical protein
MDCDKPTSNFFSAFSAFGNMFAGGTRRTDKFKGKIYKFNHKANFDPYENRYDIVKREKDGRDIKEVIAEIHGSWLENIVIGGEEYWNVNNKDQLYSIANPVLDPLPSD